MMYIIIKIKIFPSLFHFPFYSIAKNKFKVYLTTQKIQMSNEILLSNITSSANTTTIAFGRVLSTDYFNFINQTDNETVVITLDLIRLG